ncbi:Protein CBR-CNC-11 [Caenorhabditis briggsae]|uniref:Protein CBR-CNC-11 n=1 Tax=Caenorhabditis briggsae TaxID=6238 RepID=A8X2J2_CAEBR|nr:Protein CBR-CNC-11 [Caenorhabditis briggsae]CAP26852.1 Protein CBR-CNC-11 [Caenorhabditis briggsae]
MFRYILILLVALIAFSSAQWGYGPYYGYPANPGYGAYGGGLLGLLIGKK